MTIDEIMRSAPVIPVLVLDGDRDWGRLAEAFVGAGLPVLEVTLRTPSAFRAMRQMSEVPGALVGAGTVLNEAQLSRAVEEGAQFIVSPGLTESLGRAVQGAGIPFLPGVATATDVMRGLDLGFERFKFFPAAAAGGIGALRALSGPFPHARFCPTGGITFESAPKWLELDAVLCVGGSWLYRGLDDSLEQIDGRARAAAALRH